MYSQNSKPHPSFTINNRNSNKYNLQSSDTGNYGTSGYGVSYGFNS